MRLGEYQKLVVIKKVEFGVYLAERMEDETRVLRTGSLRRQTHRS